MLLAAGHFPTIGQQPSVPEQPYEKRRHWNDVVGLRNYHDAFAEIVVKVPRSGTIDPVTSAERIVIFGPFLYPTCAATYLNYFQRVGHTKREGDSRGEKKAVIAMCIVPRDCHHVGSAQNRSADSTSQRYAQLSINTAKVVEDEIRKINAWESGNKGLAWEHRRNVILLRGGLRIILLVD